MRRSTAQTEAENGLYEIGITTGAAGAILRAMTERAMTERAMTERAVALEAETPIRRAHSRGTAIAVAVTCSDGQAVRRLELDPADVVSGAELS